MNRKPLSPRQQVLDFIRDCRDTGRSLPIEREIARHPGLNTSSPVRLHVNALRRKGLELPPGQGPPQPRRRAGSLEPADRISRKRRHQVTGIPILGSIPAGMGELRHQDPDGLVQVDLEGVNIPRSSRMFALRVTGDSMIGKCIMEGDIVILEQNADPQPGEVVAAFIDGQSTLKTFLLDRGRPFLRAENPHYPKLIPLNELMIQGVMRMLVRASGKKKSG